MRSNQIALLTELFTVTLEGRSQKQCEVICHMLLRQVSRLKVLWPDHTEREQQVLVHLYYNNKNGGG